MWLAAELMKFGNPNWVEWAMQRLQKGEKWEGWKTEEERRTALVFTTSAGHYISPTSIRYHFKKLAVDIGVPECRVHDLRHTFAVLSLQNGDDIKTVQDAFRCFRRPCGHHRHHVFRIQQF